MKHFYIFLFLFIICTALLFGCNKQHAGTEKDRQYENTGIDQEADIASQSTVEHNTNSNINSNIDSHIDATFESEIYNGMTRIDASIWINDDLQYQDLVHNMIAVCKQTDPQGSFLLANDQDILFMAGLNALEIDGETPVNPYTTYEIASLTKQFTAAAILQLEAQGRLSTSDTLGKYFPDFVNGADITIDELLHMRSGLVDYYTEYETFFADADETRINQIRNGQIDDQTFLSYLYQTELKFAPGSQMQYCNTNYLLLAMIMEQTSHMTYEEYIQQNFFDKCNMTNSTCCEVGNLTSVPEIKDGYTKLGRLCRGAGDIHSNVIDLLNWERMLHQGKILDENQLNKMFDMQDNYGCGFMGDDFGNHFHTGGLESYESFVGIFETETYGRLYLIQLYPCKNNELSITSFIHACTQ